MVSLYKIKKDSPIIEFIRQEIINQGYYTDEIAIGCSVDNMSFTNHDIYGHKWGGNQSRVPFINISIFYRLKPKCPKYPGYDNYEASTGSSIHLKSFLAKYPQWQEINEWADPIVVPKVKCVYVSHNENRRTFGVKMPDGSVVTSNFPDSWKDFNLGECKLILESMETAYYRSEMIDKIEGIIRNQYAYVYPFSYKYDIIENNIVINDVHYQNISIFKLIKDGNIEICDRTKKDLKFDVESISGSIKDIIINNDN